MRIARRNTPKSAANSVVRNPPGNAGNAGDRCTSEFDPDMLQQPHRQPLRKQSTHGRLQSASPRSRGSWFPHGEHNHHMERSMNDEQDNGGNMQIGRTLYNGQMEQRDRRQRASRPEDFDSRAPHTLEPERIQCEFRPHRTSPNAEDDEAPAHHLDTTLKSFFSRRNVPPRDRRKKNGLPSCGVSGEICQPRLGKNARRRTGTCATKPDPTNICAHS